MNLYNLLQVAGLIVAFIGSYFLIRSTTSQDAESIANKSALWFFNYTVAKGECSQRVNYLFGFSLLTVGLYMQILGYFIANLIIRNQIVVLIACGFLLSIILNSIIKWRIEVDTSRVSRIYYSKKARDDFENSSGKSLTDIGKYCGLKRRQEESDDQFKARIREILTK